MYPKINGSTRKTGSKPLIESSKKTNSYKSNSSKPKLCSIPVQANSKGNNSATTKRNLKGRGKALSLKNNRRTSMKE